MDTMKIIKSKVPIISFGILKYIFGYKFELSSVYAAIQNVCPLNYINKIAYRHCIDAQPQISNGCPN